MRLRVVGLILGFLAIAVLSGLAVNYLLTVTATQAPPVPPVVAVPATPVPPAPATSAPASGSIFNEIFGSPEPAAEVREHWSISVFRILARLALAAGLASLLAFRPRRNLPLLQRSPSVAQTQILLAVVASALMMIVGDNAARAFGIFAAASLVRFRTNISDPKEITVLLIGLAIGLATGVGPTNWRSH